MWVLYVDDGSWLVFKHCYYWDVFFFPFFFCTSSDSLLLPLVIFFFWFDVSSRSNHQAETSRGWAPGCHRWDTQCQLQQCRYIYLDAYIWTDFSRQQFFRCEKMALLKLQAHVHKLKSTQIPLCIYHNQPVDPRTHPATHVFSIAVDLNLGVCRKILEVWGPPSLIFF